MIVLRNVFFKENKISVAALVISYISDRKVNHAIIILVTKLTDGSNGSALLCTGVTTAKCVKLYAFNTQRNTKRNPNLCNSPIRFCVVGSFKWWVANQTFIAEDPNGPQVHLLSVGVPLDHLWREVVQRPAHRTTPGVD